MIRRLVAKAREYLDKRAKINEEYAALYQRCLEDPEKMEFRFAIWDSVFERTRFRREC